jgi:mannose-1-phosphate guanylyltransferase
MSGKNTAPAIGLGALHIAQADPQATMAVLTADHLISNETAFCQALQTAAEVAQSSQLVTLGITPTGPETGFGYIQRGEMMDHYQGGEVYKVKAFLEKPALPTAQKFCESGEYYWNSGMFIWRVATLFEALRQHMPTLAGQLEQLKEAIFNAETSCIVADIWPQIESESIDFGLMEKAQNVAVVPLNAGWNDVGNWAALYYELAQELGQNVSVNAQHLSIDSQGVLVQGNGKLVVTIGLENVAIIETDDAILVCAIDKTQDVKKVVEHLKTEKKEHYL